jgi:branched-chain amino acid transport system substrate-binding protein
MNMKMRVGAILVVAIVALGAVAAVGCGGSDGETGTSESGSTEVEIVKIGVAQPLTGGWSSWGIPVQKMAQLAVDEINDAGGFEAGGKTYKFEIVAEDTEATADVALKAYNKLIFQDHVKFILGPMSSTEMPVVQPLCEQNAVIGLADCAQPADAKGTYYFNGLCVGDQYIPVAFLAADKSYPEIQKVALVNGDDEGGHFNQGICTTVVKQLGWTITDSAYYAPDTKDFYPVLTKIVAHNPDLISTGATGPGISALIIKQARELGFTGKFVSPTGSDAPTILEVAGAEAAEGLIFSGTSNYLPIGYTDTMTKVCEAYIAKYDQQDPWYGEYWNNIHLIKDGIIAAGGPDTAKIVEIWNSDPSFQWDTVWGKCRWVGKEEWGRAVVPGTPFPVAVIKDGKEEVLTCPTWEEMEPLVKAVLAEQ